MAVHIEPTSLLWLNGRIGLSRARALPQRIQDGACRALPAAAGCDRPPEFVRHLLQFGNAHFDLRQMGSRQLVHFAARER